MAKPGLNGHAYRQLRTMMKISMPWICIRCEQPISREITARNPRHPKAWSADHWPIPRDEGGPTVITNMKPAHYGCNSDAGNAQKRAKQQDRTSMDWGI
jgi:hypothetical protein